MAKPTADQLRPIIDDDESTPTRPTGVKRNFMIKWTDGKPPAAQLTVSSNMPELMFEPIGQNWPNCDVLSDAKRYAALLAYCVAQMMLKGAEGRTCIRTATLTSSGVATLGLVLGGIPGLSAIQATLQVENSASTKEAVKMGYERLQEIGAQIVSDVHAEIADYPFQPAIQAAGTLPWAAHAAGLLKHR